MNTQYYNNTITQLNEIVTSLNQYSTYINEALHVQNLSCAQLALLAAEAAAKLAQASAQSTGLFSNASSDISDLQTNITAQLAILAPLLISPSTLPEVITWITSAIALFAGPNTSYLAQQTILVTQLANITAAAVSVAASIATITTSVTNAIANKQSSMGCV